MSVLTGSLVVAFALAGQTDGTESALPDNIAKELDFFVGDWKAEGSLAGKTLTGRWSAQWAPHKQCILIRSAVSVDGERVWANGVSGWDPAKEKIVTVQFFSNGVLEDIRYTMSSPGVQNGVYSVSMKGQEPLTADCEVRTKKPDEWTFKSAVNVFDGEKAQEFVIRFVRSPGKPKTGEAKN